MTIEPPPPAVTRRHPEHRLGGATDGAGHIDAEKPLDSLRRNLVHALRRADNAGIVDETVETAEDGVDGGKDRLDPLFPAHVAFDGNGCAPSLQNASDHLFGRVAIGRVVDRDPPTLAGRGKRNRGADAAAAPGDEKHRSVAHDPHPLNRKTSELSVLPLPSPQALDSRSDGPKSGSSIWSAAGASSG